MGTTKGDKLVVGSMGGTGMRCKQKGQQGQQGLDTQPATGRKGKDRRQQQT